MKKRTLVPFVLFGFLCTSYSQHELKWHNFVALSGRSIAVDPFRDSVLWIAGGGGLIRYNHSSNSWKSFTTADGLSKIWGRSIFVSKDFIWVGTESGGANLFELARERFTPFLQFPLSPSYPEYRPTVNVIYPENDVVWVGTDRGLFLVNSNSLDTLRRFTMADGLGENYVYSIVDDGQYLWLATAYGGAYIPEFPPTTGGLSRLNKATHEIQNFRVAEGPYVNWFWSMAGTGDTLWIAGGPQLLIFDKRTGLFSTILQDVIQSPHAVVADEEDIWCTGWSGDGKIYLFQIDRHSGSLKSSSDIPNNSSAAGIDIDGSNVYLVTENRLYVAARSSLQLEEVSSPFLPSAYCYAVSGDNQEIYAGLNDHLVSLDQQSISSSELKTVQVTGGLIRGITLDGDNLWVGTDNGLFQIRTQNLVLTKSLLSSIITHFTVIDDRYVWASTHLGLYKIDKLTDQMIKRDLTSELNTFGPPRILSVVLDGDVVWLSFAGQENGGGLISGLVKLDRTTLGTLAVKKVSIGDYTQAIEALIDRGSYLLASGKQISKVSKSTVTIEPFINQKAGKMVLSGSSLWTIVPSQGAKLFDVETGQEKLSLSESNGLLHNWATDVFVSDKYAWFTTYGGISALELSSITDVPKEKDNSKTPALFLLLQNYPNPFNPSTTIQYTIGGLANDASVNVRLVIYDILGQEVETLVERLLQPGTYRVTWDGTDNSGKRAPSGVYIYRLMAGNYVSSKTMVMVK